MSPRLSHPEIPDTNQGVRIHLEQSSKEAAAETAIQWAQSLANDTNDKKRFYKKEGQLGKYLIESNPRAARLVANVLAETPSGRKLLTNPPGWMKKLNSAEATYFAMGLAERLEDAAPLVAYNDGLLAKALFVNSKKPEKGQENTVFPYHNGVAKSLAPLLAATEEGRKVLKSRLNGGSFAAILYRADDNVYKSVADSLPKPSPFAGKITSAHSDAKSSHEKQR